MNLDLYHWSTSMVKNQRTIPNAATATATIWAFVTNTQYQTSLPYKFTVQNSF